MLAFFLSPVISGPAMSYEEPKYKVVSETDTYEVRRYEKRPLQRSLLTKTTVGSEFCSIIFQEPIRSRKVDMTVPVTQSES